MNSTEEQVLFSIDHRINEIENIIGNVIWESRCGDFYHPIRVISTTLSDNQIEDLQEYLDDEQVSNINLFIDIHTRINKRLRILEITISIDYDVNPEEWTNNYIIGAITKVYPIYI